MPVGRTASHPRQVSHLAFRAGLLLPGGLVTFLLVLFALALVVFLAFRLNDGSLLGGGFTLENIASVVADPLTWTVALRSVVIAALVTLATIVLAVPVAVYLAFHAGPRRGLILFLVTLPFWTSYLLRVMSWKVILGFNGVLNSALMELGLISEPSTAFLYNTSAVIITLTHAWAVFAILPLYVSLEKVDRTLLEAATDLGDRPWQRFRRIVLPLTEPGVRAALLVVMIPTVGDFVTPRLVGGKDGVMIASAIQAQFGKGANWPLGAALSVTTMTAVTALALSAAGLIRIWARRAR